MSDRDYTVVLTPPWLAKVLAAIRPLIPREFFGAIEVHVSHGGITTVHIRQTFKDGEDERPKG